MPVVSQSIGANPSAVYVRVSTDSQTTENQERELRDLASRMGWQIVQTYRDEGISGAKGRDKRPDSMPYAGMLTAAGSTSSWRGR
jgi:hypothetical protein